VYRSPIGLKIIAIVYLIAIWLSRTEKQSKEQIWRAPTRWTFWISMSSNCSGFPGAVEWYKLAQEALLVRTRLYHTSILIHLQSTTLLSQLGTHLELSWFTAVSTLNCKAILKWCVFRFQQINLYFGQMTAWYDYRDTFNIVNIMMCRR